jgi:hypothetical protein
MKPRILKLGIFLIWLAGGDFAARAQPTAFTYQGQLQDNGSPAMGVYDLRFAIFNLSSGGTQQGGAVTSTATVVSNGLFTVVLDFGNVFDGGARWIEIAARASGGGAFTTLNPRQPITVTPYAVRSLQVANGAITAQSLADGSVTADKLAPGAVSQLGGPGGSPANAVQVATNGLVGIGTAAPQAGLHINTGAALPTLEVLFQVQNGTGAFTNLASVSKVAVQGTMAVITAADSDALTLVSLTNPASPQILSHVRNGSGSFTNLDSPADVAWSGSNFVVASRSQGGAVTIVSAANPTSLVRLAVLRDGVGGFNEMNVPGSVAVSGNLLAIGSELDHAVTLVDISNPVAPVLRSVMKDGLNGFNALQHVAGVAFSGNLLAIASLEESAVTLVEVSNPANPVLRATLRDGEAGFDALADAFGLAFSGNLLGIAATYDDAVTLVDVGNPSAPVKLAELRDDGRDMALGGAWALAFSGNRLAVAALKRNAVTLFDVSAPSNPKLLARATDGFAGVDSLLFPSSVAFFGADVLVSSSGDSALSVLRLTQERAGLISSDWVGIGTSHPVAPLHVAGDFVVEDADAITLDARTIALGRAAAATGESAIAIGAGASSSGDSGIALGQGAEARGIASVAVGRSARALHSLSFVCNAGGNAFSSTGPGQFLIRAPGGVGINVNDPTPAALMVDGDIRFGTDGQFHPSAAEERLRILRGVVSSAGVSLHGHGYTVTRTAAGSYTVTFATPFAAFPAVTVSAQAGVARMATTTNVGTTQAQVRTFDAAGALVDTQFHFIATAPR